MIDRLVSFVAHERIVTSKHVAHDDPCVEPTAAFPGALVLEGIGQTASLLYLLSYERQLEQDVPLLGHLRAEGVQPVENGATILFSVRAVKMTPTMGLFEGVAEVDGRVVGRSELALGVAKPGEPPGQDS
jgi:3-hydroxymyristoyl/3-hydroxydecanoyl-(acyl carrier protein) dehydratase